MLRTIARPRLAALFATLAVSLLVATTVDARPGRGGNIGSRGERTYSAPPPTTTAPRTTNGMDRTVTQAPRGPQTPNAGGVQQRPSFGGGMLGGFAAGLLGAGLIGMLFGGGFFSGLAGLTGFLGLLLQLALIAGIVMLVMRFVRGRREAVATAGGPDYQRQATGPAGPGYGSGIGGATAARAPQQPAQRDAVGIGPQDYQEFERLLSDVQTAYGRSDIGTLRMRASPEMASYFEGELADLRDRGLTPRISDVRLLQGDLAEAWREDAIEYATVAMRYSLVDQTFDRTGRLVDGQPTPVEATELWTFVRGPMTSGRWYLSAIQQAG